MFSINKYFVQLRTILFLKSFYFLIYLHRFSKIYKSMNILSKLLPKFLFIIIVAFTVTSCKKREMVREISVNTDSVSSITAKSAIGYGELVDLGENQFINTYGHCWATTENPTITNDTTRFEDADTEKKFKSVIRNLVAGKMYFVRTYARFGQLVVYGNQITFSTISQLPPEISTDKISSIQMTSVEVSATIQTIGAGTDSISQHGFVWSKSTTTPILGEASSVSCNLGVRTSTGAVSYSITGLSSSSVYYVRAYATNRFGTVYGQVLSFTTLQRTLDMSKIALVTGGTLTMGADTISSMKPEHQVKISSFYIGKYEVTNKEFADFLNLYKSDVVKSGNYAGYSLLTKQYSDLLWDGTTWKPKTTTDRKPVVAVTWYGANEYCKYYGGRLPTEAEWEWASKGADKSLKYSYSGSADPTEVAWFKEKLGDGSTHPVGLKNANEIGIYDMSGNALEWCNDWHSDAYYQVCKDQGVIENPQGPNTGTARVARGGAWDASSSYQVMSTYRYYGNPTQAFNKQGFRFAADLMVK